MGVFWLQNLNLVRRVEMWTSRTGTEVSAESVVVIIKALRRATFFNALFMLFTCAGFSEVCGLCLLDCFFFFSFLVN